VPNQFYSDEHDSRSFTSTATEENVLSRKKCDIVPYSGQVHFSPHPHISLECMYKYVHFHVIITSQPLQFLPAY
jgi:hypothetical protein